MKLLIQNAQVLQGDDFIDADVLIEGETIAAVGQGLCADGAEIINAAGLVLSPGFCDLHVHLRQPGYESKETIASGTAAAAAGGFTTVCAMPNLNPVPDSPQSLDVQLTSIEKDALVEVLPYGALTIGQKGNTPADLDGLAAHCCGFSDDGFGVQNDGLMRTLMEKTAQLGGLIAAHCEVNALLPQNGTCVQANSAFAKQHGFAGHSNESEWAEVMRDIKLAEEADCRLHICHASASKTFDLVRQAQARGLKVTCEISPHNLLLSCNDITENDGRFKMNPPLRTPQDVQAALRALADGTASAVATDHAPHTAQEKAGGFAKSFNGIVGLETAFPVLYTHLVLKGVISLETLLARFSAGPAAVLGRPAPKIAAGQPANLTLLDLETEKTVNPEAFKTKGRATPFAGWRLRGWPKFTIYNGNIVFGK